VTSPPAPRGRPGRPGVRSTFESFSIPDFRWLFISNSTFFLAMGGQMLVRPYLAYQLTDSPLALGIVTVSMAIPMLVLSPFGGVLADKIERRNLIAGAQCAATVGEAAVLLLLVLGLLEYWHLVLSTFALGCTFPLSMPARQAIVMNLVGKRGLGNAVALNMGIQNVTRVVGPALAGFMIPQIGVQGAYGVNIGLYLLAVLSVLRIPRFDPPSEARSVPIRESLIGGFRYVGENRLVLVLLLYGLVPMFLATPFQSLLVIFTEDVWHTGPQGLGILNASIGIGGVAGSIFVAARAPGEGRLRVMAFSALCFGGLLAAAAFSPWFLPAVLLVFLGHGFSTAFGTLNNTAIQLLIPDSVRGRISSFLMMSFSVPMLGTLPVSAAAEAFGAPLAVGVASVLAMLSALAFYAFSKDLRNLDAHVAHAMHLDSLEDR
jgi:MFS family permease